MLIIANIALLPPNTTAHMASVPQNPGTGEKKPHILSIAALALLPPPFKHQTET